MKTEEEIRESIKWLQKRMRESENALGLDEDVTGIEGLLIGKFLSVYAAKLEALKWVLETEE